MNKLVLCTLVLVMAACSDDGERGAGDIFFPTTGTDDAGGDGPDGGTSGTSDTGGDTADAETDDTQPPDDTGDFTEDIEDPPGDQGEPCSSNDECETDYCVEGTEGGVCASFCLTDCTPGWTCKGISNAGGDLTYICVPTHPNLCRPCITDADCKADIVVGNDRCVPHEGGEAYCGGQCEHDGHCEDGFTCQTVEGGPAQCVPDETATCECTPKYVAEAAATLCEASNEMGTCSGQRVCTDDGLTACDAIAPSAEVCDLLDNDCNGLVDDGLDCGNEGDTDGDGVLDSSDNCPKTPNTAQEDLDEDGLGDVCDPDKDGDLVDNEEDNCPEVENTKQEDLNSDGEGDLCDDDDDGDGLSDEEDN